MTTSVPFVPVTAVPNTCSMLAVTRAVPCVPAAAVASHWMTFAETTPITVETVPVARNATVPIVAVDWFAMRFTCGVPVVPGTAVPSHCTTLAEPTAPNANG